MTQRDRLHQLMMVWRTPTGEIRTTADIAAAVPAALELTPGLLNDVLKGTKTLTDGQAEAVAVFFKVPAHYLAQGDAQIDEQLALLGHLVSAGAKSVRLRGKASPETRRALLAAVSRRTA